MATYDQEGENRQQDQNNPSGRKNQNCDNRQNDKNGQNC